MTTTTAAVTVPRDPYERVAYAEETLRLAEELWDYIFPPWRWCEWLRRKRIVDGRNAALQAVHSEEGTR